jgi:hypothetical protein
MTPTPVPPDMDLHRFSIGQRFGQCLVRGCTAFIGTVQSLGRPVKEPGEDDAQRAMMLRQVDLKVQDWLYRKEPAAATATAAAQTTRVQHAAAPALSKTAVGPWSAWQGVRLEVGSALVVARWAATASRPSWMGQPDDVALAVSDKSLFPSLREVAAQQRQFERDPGLATAMATRLLEKKDPLLSGYLLAYLTEHESARDVERAAAALGELLAHPALPAPGLTLVIEWQASSFYRLSKTARAAAVDGLLTLAGGDDPARALPALRGLVRLADQKLLELPKSLAGPSRQKIVDAYRALQAKDKSAHPEFEWQLGLR